MPGIIGGIIGGTIPVGSFKGIVDKVGPDFDVYDNKINVDEVPGMMGTESLFNQYSVFSLIKASANSRTDSYNTNVHKDVQKSFDDFSNYSFSTITYEDPITGKIADNGGYLHSDDYSSNSSKRPTAQNIIDYAKDEGGLQLTGPMPYSWSDFLYCKYYGMIPNNNLITLRRYPLPVYDNAKTPNGEPIPPIAQAVTWMGEQTENKMSEVMSFSYGLVWKEIEAEVQDIEGIERGFGVGAEAAGSKYVGKAGSILSMFGGKAAQSRWSGLSEKEQDWRRGAWDNNGPYWNQVYGPVNVVHKTHMRDRGMEFDHTIKLNFHYSLKSINSLNPKVVMLDLISSFLSLTYNNAKFWGGANRYFPNYADATLFMGDQNAFYSGNWDGYFESVGDKLSSMGSSLIDGLKQMFSKGGGGLSELLNVIKDKAGNAIMGKLTRQSRPHILSIRSLLSGDPIGEWHLTIGNPMNPSFTIGNLIVDDVKVVFGDILGADDFPTDVTFTVTLKHGRPRDKGDIESMLNYGYGRMTYSPMTRMPSAAGTFGQAYVKDAAANAAAAISGGAKNLETETEKFVTTADTYNRVHGRMSRQWGPKYADSSNFGWILGKTKGKF